MKREEAKKALVVEGGAMRGIFAAGVLDGFLEAGQTDFDFAIGVSAGSTNLIGFLAGDHGRNRQILLQHARQPEFLNWRRFLKGGHFCDVSWLWHASFEQVPLNTQYYLEQNRPLYVVTTNVDTGFPVYTRVTADNLHELFPASCAIPLAYRDFPTVDGAAMTDGGLADSIPVIKAYEMGARDITVILSQPRGFRKKIRPLPTFMKRFFKHHPALFDAVARRSVVYNDAIDFIEDPPGDCAMTVLAPPADFPVGRFTQDKKLLEQGYEMGRNAALATTTA
ncbi:patatin family protein [Idiomarina sp. HP20-50]|uniref:patatin-like phospholipase family protein n=1 Tax=Idiomarina sp. HP20-50 TaxID=3070813 RepID=UPI00294AB3CA|nr:patatin family protein [Idiomarina sp. HP20-50]MDV6316607.1 patatin family protein [Idiomarina sp. HP20-50]